MSSAEEKVFDQFWDRVRPFVTITRLIEFLGLIVVLSPTSDLLLDLRVLNASLVDFAERAKNVLTSIEIWKAAVLALFVFLVSPLFSAYSIRTLITKWHVNYAGPLFVSIVGLYKKTPEEARSITVAELADLLHRKTKGAARFEILKGVAEVLTSSGFVMIYFIYALTWTQEYLYPAIIAAWFFCMYLLSQRMMVIFLRDIQPFNIIDMKRNVLH